MSKAPDKFYNTIKTVVPRELLKTNVIRALAILGLSEINCAIVGNTNTEFLGDIDIAVDASSLQKLWDIKPGELFWDDIEKKLTELQLNYRIIKNFNQFHITLPLIDSQNMPGRFIQIDFFVGNLPWIKKIMSGAPIDSSYKSLYRNLFLISMFSNIRWYSNENIYSKLVLDTKLGLKISKRVILSTSARTERYTKIEERFVTQDPNSVTKFLFKNKENWNDIDSFEKLWELYSSNSEFRYPKFRNKINEEFVHTLETLGKEVPQSLI